MVYKQKTFGYYNNVLIRLRKVLDEKPGIDIPVLSSYGTVIYVKYNINSIDIE